MNTNSSFVKKSEPKRIPTWSQSLSQHSRSICSRWWRQLRRKSLSKSLPFSYLLHCLMDRLRILLILWVCSLCTLARNPSDDAGLHLLAFAPLLDKTNFTAVNHANFIKASLEWYSLSLLCTFCLIGDNCQTNKATADILGVPLLGCHRHHFNLAVEAYL